MGSELVWPFSEQSEFVVPEAEEVEEDSEFVCSACGRQQSEKEWFLYAGCGA